VTVGCAGADQVGELSRLPGDGPADRAFWGAALERVAARPGGCDGGAGSRGGCLDGRRLVVVLDLRSFAALCGLWSAIIAPVDDRGDEPHHGNEDEYERDGVDEVSQHVIAAASFVAFLGEPWRPAGG